MDRDNAVPFPPLNFVVSTFGFRSVARHRDLSLSTSLFASGLIKRFLARGAAARVRATKSFTATNDESAKPHKNCRPNAFPNRRGQLRADVFPFPLRERWSSCELCRARLVTIGGIGIITATVAAARGHTKKGPIHRGNRPGYHQRNDGAAATWKGGGKRREAKIPWNFLPRFSLSLCRASHPATSFLSRTLRARTDFVLVWFLAVVEPKLNSTEFVSTLLPLYV